MVAPVVEGRQQLAEADLPLVVCVQHAHEGARLLQVRLQQLPPPQPPCRRHSAGRQMRLLWV